MNYNSLCNDIFALDKDIRFTGVCDCTGKIKYGGTREGLISLLSPDEEQKSNLLALERWRLYHRLEGKTGRVRYAMEEYEKVKTVTIALPDEHLLLVSLAVDSDHGKIIERIIKLVLSQYMKDFL